MNSTPNYNFKDHIKLCAVDAIDRELRHVEDKVDCNTASILDRYTKAEIDCLLRKCSGGSCGPAPCDCDCGPELEKLWQALRERYTNEKIYNLIQKLINVHDTDPDAHGDIREKLETKVDISNTWHDLELENGFIGNGDQTPQFCKIGNLVVLRGLLVHESGVSPLITTVATLPEGFYSTKYDEFLLLATSSNFGGGYARLSISRTGKLSIDYASNQDSLNKNLDMSCSFGI